MANKKTNEKAEKPKKNINVKKQLAGYAELLVVLSASYASYMIIAGTDELVYQVLVAPLVIWAVVKLVIRFSR
jgi:hypothetical protein